MQLAFQTHDLGWGSFLPSYLPVANWNALFTASVVGKMAAHLEEGYLESQAAVGSNDLKTSQASFLLGEGIHTNLRHHTQVCRYLTHQESKAGLQAHAPMILNIRGSSMQMAPSPTPSQTAPGSQSVPQVSECLPCTLGN